MAGEVMEEVRRIWRKVAVMNHVNSFLQLRVAFIVLPRVVANGGCVRVCGEATYRREIVTEGGRERERKRERYTYQQELSKSALNVLSPLPP